MSHTFGRFVQLLCERSKAIHAMARHIGTVYTQTPRSITYSLIYYLLDTFMKCFEKCFSYFSADTESKSYPLLPWFCLSPHHPPPSSFSLPLSLFISLACSKIVFVRSWILAFTLSLLKCHLDMAIFIQIYATFLALWFIRSCV